MSRVFLLSPANMAGERAGLLLNPRAGFALARHFQRDGIPLGDAFTFTSGLYFRGKLTYALRFARAEDGDVVRVITTNRGLLDPSVTVGPEDIRAFGKVDITEDDPRYRLPLKKSAAAIARKIGPSGQAILLGSIATAKYRDVLLECFGDRLLFPSDFVGRGDMSRGALLLRAARDGLELRYSAVAGAITRGKRAPKVGALALRADRAG